MSASENELPRIWQPRRATDEDSSQFSNSEATLLSSPSVEDEGNTASHPLGHKEEPMQTPNRHKHKTLWKIWALEISSILCSFGAFVSIVVVLSEFDQRSLPDWPFRVTLNSFLAFFTTLAKAAFMLPVSKAISQTSWSWFQRDRPLYDFYALDQASRGFWGAAILLKRIGFSHFMFLGAILTITSALTSPLTQLAINYPMRSTKVLGEANIWAIDTIRMGYHRTDTTARRAILLATLDDTSLFKRPISPVGASCSTGNCTFEQYESLGICVKMANITSQLQINETDYPERLEIPYANSSGIIAPGNKTWIASLPGGFDLVQQKGLGVIIDMLNGNHTFAFQDDESLLQTRLASMVTIYSAPLLKDNGLEILNKATNMAEIIESLDGFQFEAVEVLYHVCVQSYQTSVSLGVEKTNMISSLANPVDKKSDSFLDMECDSLAWDVSLDCVFKDSERAKVIDLQSSAQNNKSSLGNGIFSADYGSMELIANEMKTGLSGYAIADPLAKVAVTGDNFIKAAYVDVLYRPPNIANHTERDIGLKNIFENVAISISSGIRTGYQKDQRESGFEVVGQAWRTESYVKITWGWITFLAAELAFATGFLLLTILAQKSNDQTEESGEDCGALLNDLKDSSLATLVALDSDCRDKLGNGLQSLRRLENNAKELRVRIRGNKFVVSDDSI